MSDYGNTILEDLNLLNQAMYDKLATITGISGMKFKGFDSGKDDRVLPPVAMKISIADHEIDRTRPTPMEGHRITTETGTPSDYEVEGELVEDVYPTRLFEYPIPISVTYQINAWCHDARVQSQMDLALMQKFPERGTLALTIEDSVFEFPIELLGIQNITDLAQKIHEKVYRYKVDCYVKGWIEDKTGKIITKVITEYYEGDEEDSTLLDTDEIVSEKT